MLWNSEKTLIWFLMLGFLVACTTGSKSTNVTTGSKSTNAMTGSESTNAMTGSKSTNAMMVGQINATTPDEEAIYGILENLIDYISSSQWEKWLSLYSADAILTAGQKQVDKVEMRGIVDGLTYKITEMEILKKNIGKEQAFVSVRMIGNGKKHLETYNFKKFNGKWLIVKETNP